LKGIGNGVMDGPQLRAWIQDAAPPKPHYEERPGRWVAEETWPSGAIERLCYALGPGSLAPKPVRETPLAVRSPEATGLDSGLWCPYGDAVDMAPDQRVDDGLSLSFTSAPLEERVEILGFPEVSLEVSADRTLALVAVRLCDVAPTGASTLVTTGVLNLTHRESHEEPSPLEPGRRYGVTVRLNSIAHGFPPGHRLRVAVSPTYWPWVWPSPEPVTLTVLGGELELPVRPPRTEDEAPAAFEEPEGSPPLAVETLAEGTASRTIERDVATGAVTLTYAYGGGRKRLPSGLELEDAYRETFSIVEGDPLSAEVRCNHSVRLGRGAWQTLVVTESVMRSDAASFHLTNVVEAYEGEEQVFARTRELTVPRDLV
jgi:predicted acyl esterase